MISKVIFCERLPVLYTLASLLETMLGQTQSCPCSSGRGIANQIVNFCIPLHKYGLHRLRKREDIQIIACGVLKPNYNQSCHVLRLALWKPLAKRSRFLEYTSSASHRYSLYRVSFPMVISCRPTAYKMIPVSGQIRVKRENSDVSVIESDLGMAIPLSVFETKGTKGRLVGIPLGHSTLLQECGATTKCASYYSVRIVWRTTRGECVQLSNR